MDGFDSPVGTLAERCGSVVLPGLWNCGLGYGVYYLLSGTSPAYHTGADIALEPYGGYGQPVYAVADGTVTFSKDVTGTTWRNLIVLDHGDVCSRYGHLKTRLVQPRDTVYRGQQIGTLGNADGAFAPHLHFDISPGQYLSRVPWDWPGPNLAAVRQKYVDPLVYIREHRPMLSDQIIALAKQIETLAAQLEPAPPPPPVVTTPMWVIADGVRGRSGPGLTFSILHLFNTGDAVGKVDEQNGWTHVATPLDCWISSQYVGATNPKA